MEFEFIKRKMPASFALSDADLEKKVRHDKAQEMAREYVAEAMFTLIGVMRGSLDEKLRVKCAMAIIDRAYGTPKQVIEGGDSDSIVEVLARISSGQSLPAPQPTGNPVIDMLDANGH